MGHVHCWEVLFPVIKRFRSATIYYCYFEWLFLPKNVSFTTCKDGYGPTLDSILVSSGYDISQGRRHFVIVLYIRKLHSHPVKVVWSSFVFGSLTKYIFCHDCNVYCYPLNIYILLCNGQWLNFVRHYDCSCNFVIFKLVHTNHKFYNTANVY